MEKDYWKKLILAINIRNFFYEAINCSFDSDIIINKEN